MLLLNLEKRLLPPKYPITFLFSRNLTTVSVISFNFESVIFLVQVPCKITSCIFILLSNTLLDHVLLLTSLTMDYFTVPGKACFKLEHHILSIHLPMAAFYPKFCFAIQFNKLKMAESKSGTSEF